MNGLGAFIEIGCLKSNPPLHPHTPSHYDPFNSLVAPVQSGGDVLLDVPHAVVGEVAYQHLPPQVQDFIHHVPKSVEQIPLILLPEQDEAGWERGWKDQFTGRNQRMGRAVGKNLVAIMCKKK